MEEKMMEKQKSMWNNDGVGVVTEGSNMLQYYQYYIITCTPDIMQHVR